MFGQKTRHYLVVESHPRDIITNAHNLPARKAGCKHGHVGFTASTGESGAHKLLFTLGVGNRHDKHMFSHPALIIGDAAGDAQSEALLSQKGVSTISRTEAHNQTVVRNVRDDCLLRVARPIINHLNT